MRFIKLLLSSSLIYIAAMAIANPTNDQKSDVLWRNALYYNLSDTILPLHYLIQVAYLRTDLPLLINYDITIHIKYATQHINFYLPNWNVSAVGLRQICTNMVHKIKLPIYYGKNYVMFDFDDVLLPDIYLLKMTLVNHEYTINNFRISTKRKSSKISFIKAGEDIQLMAHTQTKKQQIFPYWNNPKLRTTEIELSRFDIIINHHQQHTVLSNMPIKVSKPQRYNITWTYFHTTPLMPIDSIALVVTGYHRISNVTNNKTVSMLYRPQLKSQMEFSLYIMENITRYLQNNSTIVCEKDSFEKKVDHVAILDLEVEVKQTLGFVFYREADIVYDMKNDEKLDPIPCKMKIAHIIARGMAPKCISNLLGPSWFDQWLNEGYKIYFETFIIEKALPNFRMMDLFVVQVQHELLDLNTYIVINSATEHNSYPENYYSSLSHNKGSIIWRMLELTLLHDIFAKGLYIYFNNRFREPEATTSSHLWNAMQSVMNALNYKLEFNIKSIIDSWATQSCFSVLEVMRNYSSNAVTISIRFLNKLDEKQYYIPVTYTTESEHNFTITWTNITWLTPWHPQEIKFSFEKDQWIIFNLQQAGYYRVYYDTENWQRIERYLNSEKYVYIHVVNRAQIIDDAFHFAIEKKLNFSVFWEIAKYLSKENDIVAWYPMIRVFEFMSNIFVFSHSYPQFQKVVKQMEFLTFWNPLDQHNDRIEYLKQEVAKWRCFTDDNSCKTMASVQLRQDLINPYENTLSPGWKRWAYCNGLKIANIWSIFISKIKTIIFYDPTILECLAYVEDLDPKKVMNYLQTNINFLAISINEPKVPILTITSLSVFTLAKNTYMLEGILNILIKEIVHSSLAVSEIPALIVIINNVYSKGQLDEIRNFTRKEFQEPKIFNIERKIQTRCSEIERQKEFLHSFID